MTTKNSCQILEGRLMQIDVANGYRTVQDIDDMIAMIGATLSRVPAETRVIIAADWRPCKLFTPEVADRALKLLTVVNARIERSGILHRDDSSTSVLQVMRLIRESKFEHRRIFTEPAKMEQWLGEIMSPVERAQLKVFLAHRR
jgi:hypothetical protein